MLMANSNGLAPARDLARKAGIHYPNESAAYREARTALLAEEIELRRHIERVAEQRRTLPPGGEVKKAYSFQGENGPVRFSDLFGEKQTLVTYNFMFGPERERPCPMCTSLLSAWDGEARDIEQRVAFAIIARSPIERLVAFKKERGWRNLKLYTDLTGEFFRDYHSFTTDNEEIAAFNVFTRRDGKIRHFWGAETTFATADPGQDPRTAPDFMPIWTVLDTTPEGRDPKWYPKLDYGEK
jgi:predicted dithiol-disulfide oxidoreductase (DUF899 family)